LSDRSSTTVHTCLEVGQQVIRQVSEGPRLGVVQGLIRSYSSTAY
jgi:hypothetical protein